jgi:hypothetical protein
MGQLLFAVLKNGINYLWCDLTACTEFVLKMLEIRAFTGKVLTSQTIVQMCEVRRSWCPFHQLFTRALFYQCYYSQLRRIEEIYCLCLYSYEHCIQ